MPLAPCTYVPVPPPTRTLKQGFVTSMSIIKRDAHLWQQPQQRDGGAAVAGSAAPPAALAAASEPVATAATAGVTLPLPTAPSGHVPVESAIQTTSSGKLQPCRTVGGVGTGHNAADTPPPSGSSSSSDSEGGSSGSRGSGGSGLSDILGVELHYPQLTPRELLKEVRELLLVLACVVNSVTCISTSL